MSYFDDNEDRIIYGRKQNQRNLQVTCERCGATDLEWQEVYTADGVTKYRLVEHKKAHVCKMQDDEFEDRSK